MQQTTFTRHPTSSAAIDQNHLLLFKAPLERLRDGKVNEMPEGEVRMDY